MNAILHVVCIDCGYPVLVDGSKPGAPTLPCPVCELRAEVGKLDVEALAAAWRTEANEREARAENPEVVGVVERDVEEMAVRTLRRCAHEMILRKLGKP